MISMKEYLISEGVIEFNDEFFNKMGFEGINVSARIEKDENGNRFWVVTIIVGDDDGFYIRTPKKTKQPEYSEQKDYQSENSILYSYIDEIKTKIADSVIKYFLGIKAELFGDDSPLKNVWEEFCAQVQGEHSFYWDAYEAIGLNVYTGLTYLQEVWLYHRQIVEAICIKDFDLGYRLLLDHTDLLYHRPKNTYN